MSFPKEIVDMALVASGRITFALFSCPCRVRDALC
jgi:hypothetical protein